MPSPLQPDPAILLHDIFELVLSVWVDVFAKSYGLWYLHSVEGFGRKRGRAGSGAGLERYGMVPKTLEYEQLEPASHP